MGEIAPSLRATIVSLHERDALPVDQSKTRAEVVSWRGHEPSRGYYKLRISTFSLSRDLLCVSHYPDISVRDCIRFQATNMAIFLSSLLASLLGACIVCLTSPTIAHVWAGNDLTPLTLHSLAMDVLFALLIGFLILCYVEHKWVAINQSFPYTFHIKRNIGQPAFNFQLVVFELWHTNKLNRYVHMVCLFSEEFFWLCIIRGTFGLSGLFLANGLAITQAVTYRDWRLTATITLINVAYSAAGLTGFDRLEPTFAINVCKVALFWVVVLRTAVHAAEPLPPTYDAEKMSFGSEWGTGAGYNLIPKDPLRALWLFLLGIVSELASGIPGRLFSTAVYKVMYRAGYRSELLMGVDEARTEAVDTMANGWASSVRLAPFFEMGAEESDKTQIWKNMA